MTDEAYILARKRFKASMEYDSDDRAAALEDKQFYGGDQWDEEMARAREVEKRPTMTINVLPKFVRQVTGEAKMNEAAIDVTPADDKADPSLAQIYMGLVRTIEDENKAQTVYEDAVTSSAICGRGAFRLFTEYEHEMSFDQVIRMKPIPEALSVYFDPASKEYDRSDGEFCFVTDWISDEEFERRYGDGASEFNDVGIGDESSWTSDGQKRVAEYWLKEHKQKEIWLVQTQDGYEVVPADGIWTKEGLEAAGYSVVDSRKTDVITVWMYEMGGGGFLSRDGKKEDPEGNYGKKFASKYIPIVPVDGPELRVRGKVQKWSVIRWGKTPQFLYNLWTSTAAEKTSLSPKAPWIGTPKMFEGFENTWRDANVTNTAYLPYNPDPDSPSGKPERQFPDPIHASELALRQSAYEDLMHTTGITQAALGEQGNEISGVAISARQSESDIGTIDWVKNLHRSIEHAGRIIVDMIPKVYNTQRAVQITGDDGESDFIVLNQYDQVTGQVRNNITEGRYNVRVNSGPSFKTAREQTATSFIQLMGAVPMYAHLFLDFVLKNMDFKDADKAAKRVAVSLGFEQPEGEEGQPQQPDPQQVMEMQKQVADLEGKQLINAERQMNLLKKISEYSQTGNAAVLQDVQQTLMQASQGGQ